MSEVAVSVNGKHFGIDVSDDQSVYVCLAIADIRYDETEVTMRVLVRHEDGSEVALDICVDSSERLQLYTNSNSSRMGIVVTSDYLTKDSLGAER